MKIYKDWAKREFTLNQRLLAFIPEGVFFLLILPLVLFWLSGAIDRGLSIQSFGGGVWNIAAGILFMAGGLFLAMWAIITQVTAGRGTPVPMMPTQKVVAQGPFAHSRNPMTLGTILAYLGVGILIGSLSGLALVLIAGGALLLYCKFIEEKELAARFGPEYLEYKRTTPFLIPRPRRK
ncbi:MAG: isoprenylcysteine carboxylmethyltransferase family protein [Anaerolineales bacterium]|nr:isoprenylcysteine carboxylmethyltransferase family protein [Anaerolineales bacterium]